MVRKSASGSITGLRKELKKSQEVPQKLRPGSGRVGAEEPADTTVTCDHLQAGILAFKSGLPVRRLTAIPSVLTKNKHRMLI